MMKKTFITTLACLAFAATATVAAPALDLRGTTYSVDMVTAVSGGQPAGPVLRVTALSPSGTVSQEFLTVDTGNARAGSGRVFYDPGTDQLMVGWVNLDGSIAVATRQAPGLWLSPVTLETGDGGVTAFQAGLDRLSRIQVVWEGSSGLRHRSFDAITLDPIGDISDPFPAPQPPAPGRPWQPIATPEGGGDDPGMTGGSVSAAENPDPTADPAEPPSDVPGEGDDTRAPVVRSGEESFGIVAGCSVPVVYRSSGSAVDIATRSGDDWARGTIRLGSGDGTRSARTLASEIATRFCWP